MITNELIVQQARIREKDGLKYPSVTSVLKLAPNDPKLETWKVMVGLEVVEQVLQKASVRGEMAHKYIQNYFLGIQESYDINYFVDKLNESITDRVKSIQKIKGFYDAANTFIGMYGGGIKVYPEDVEKELFFNVDYRGKNYLLSGRLDFLPYQFLSNGWTICDIKTKTNLHIHQFEIDKWGMQLALYANGSGKPVEHGCIVALSEKGKVQLFHYTKEELDKYYQRALMYVEQFYILLTDVK